MSQTATTQTPCRCDAELFVFLEHFSQCYLKSSSAFQEASFNRGVLLRRISKLSGIAFQLFSFLTGYFRTSGDE